MIVNLKNLKSVLKTKLSEYEMLNKSLLEMIEHGSSKESLNAIREAINETEEYIDSIQSKIENMTLKENVKKDCEKVSLYDNIKKPTSNPNEDKEYGEYDTPYNKLNYDDEYKKQNQMCLDYPLKDQYGDVTYRNRFLVRFGTRFEIPEWYVRRVSFLSSKEKELGITVFDFINTDTKRPIIADILGMVDNIDALPFNISIDHLDPTGVVLYTERYHGCRIKEVYRNDLDYANYDMNAINMIITYSDVSYEASH